MMMMTLSLAWLEFESSRREVTGRETPGTDAARWRELGEVLAAELK